MNDLLYTAAQPFKRKGTDSLKESEYIMALSMDLNWFKPDAAKAFVQMAVEQGIMTRENGMLKARFDIHGIKIPMGFRPDASLFEERDVFELVIERILARTGEDKKKIIASVNRKKEETGGLFTIEVLGILVAQEYGIEVGDLIERSYQHLLKT